MLSMMASMPQPNNTWKLWTDHIISQTDLSFQKACMMEHSGRTSASSKGFRPNAKDIKMINKIFLEKLNNNLVTDRLVVQDKTYMIKTLSSTQIIAFNGSKYVIINRSKTKHVIAICDSKSKYEEAAIWLSKLTRKLIEKDF